MILIFYWRVKAVFNHPRERGEFLYASKFKEIKLHKVLVRTVAGIVWVILLERRHSIKRNSFLAAVVDQGDVIR